MKVEFGFRDVDKGEYPPIILKFEGTIKEFEEILKYSSWAKEN